MPNWVTNKVQAAEHVIRAMLNAEGNDDFNTMAPVPGPNDDWDGIYGDAETAAEVVCQTPLNSHPLIAILEVGNRERIDIKKMSDESFRQFVGMLENYRACGYLHSMEFARAVWGTKWNACRPKAEPENGRCEFETAWSCPTGVFEKLSERFPNEPITVTFADEDIGSNCGTLILKAGRTAEEYIAPRWDSMLDDDKDKWRAFAYEVTGRQPEPEDEQPPAKG